MASICGITFLSTEPVQSTAMSGLVALMAFAMWSVTEILSFFVWPTTTPRSRPILVGSMSTAPTMVNPLRVAHCLTTAVPMGPSPMCSVRMPI